MIKIWRSYDWIKDKCISNAFAKFEPTRAMYCYLNDCIRNDAISLKQNLISKVLRAASLEIFVYAREEKQKNIVYQWILFNKMLDVKKLCTSLF